MVDTVVFYIKQPVSTVLAVILCVKLIWHGGGGGGDSLTKRASNIPCDDAIVTSLDNLVTNLNNNNVKLI